jgi:hypothetical protein
MTRKSLDAKILKGAFPQLNQELIKKSPKFNGGGSPTDNLIRRLDRVEKAGKSELLGELALEKYTLSPDQIPQSETILQRQVARNMGIDTEQIEDYEFKEKLAEQQTNSLAKWTSYLSSPDALFPSEFKYFVLRSVTKLDKEGEKRSKKSSSEFPPFSPDALAKVYDILIKNNMNLSSEEIEAKETNGNKFWKLYSLAIRKSQEEVNYNLENQAEGLGGIWRKFEQGSDGTTLALAVNGSGWCTAGAQMAQSQLDYGDFYVYFTQNKNTNLLTIPRIAIRMQEGQIAEVRGIKGEKRDGNALNADQEVEPELMDIVSEKLTEFPDAEEYQEKVDDMKQLTSIEYKTKNDLALDKDELRFLYQLDKRIKGFGYDSDPRIEEIQSQRNERQDLSVALGIDKSLIATKYKELTPDTEWANTEAIMNFDFDEGSSKIIRVILDFIDNTRFEPNSKIDNKVKEYRKNLSTALTIISCEEQSVNNQEISLQELNDFYNLQDSGYIAFHSEVNDYIRVVLDRRNKNVLKMRNQKKDLALTLGIDENSIAGKYEEISDKTELATREVILGFDYTKSTSETIAKIKYLAKNLLAHYRHDKRQNDIKELINTLDTAWEIINIEEKTTNNEKISRRELEPFYALKYNKNIIIPPSMESRYNELLQKRDLTADLAQINKIEPEKIALDITAIKPETTHVLCNGKLIMIKTEQIKEEEQVYISIIDKVKTNQNLSKVELAHLVCAATSMYPGYLFDDYRELDTNKLKEIYNIPILPEHNGICDVIRTEIRNFYGIQYSRKAILESKRDLKSDQAEFPEAYSDIEYEDDN